jgi:hypothetical protein
MRLGNKISNGGGMPMISPSHSGFVVHALLNDGPLTVNCDDKAVKVDLKSVCNGIVVDFCRQAACSYQILAIQGPRSATSRSSYGVFRE